MKTINETIEEEKAVRAASADVWTTLNRIAPEVRTRVLARIILRLDKEAMQARGEDVPPSEPPEFHANGASVEHNGQTLVQVERRRPNRSEAPEAEPDVPARGERTALVRSLLKERGRLFGKDIAERVYGSCGAKSIQKTMALLYNLKNAGEATRLDDGSFSPVAA